MLNIIKVVKHLSISKFLTEASNRIRESNANVKDRWFGRRSLQYCRAQEWYFEIYDVIKDHRPNYLIYSKNGDMVSLQQQLKNLAVRSRYANKYRLYDRMTML